MISLVVAAAGVWVSVLTNSAVGLAAVPALLYVAVDQGAPTRAGEVKLAAERTLKVPKALVQERVLVELKVKNEGGAVEKMMCEDVVPQGARIDRGSNFMVCRLGPGESATMRYEVAVREPTEVTFGECRVRAQSRFGLSETKLSLDAPASLRVYPRLVTRRVATGRSRSFSWTGSSPSRYKGGHLEFVDIRQYVPGDPLRDVNWRASARLRKRLVNEWRSERGLDCIVVVDFSTESLARVGEWSARADVINCSYELAHALIAGNNRVGLLVLGQVPSRLRPGFGSRQLRAMVDQLVNAQEGNVWKFEHVDFFLETFFRRQYRVRGGTLFFVSAGPSLSLLGAVRSLSEKNFNCNCVMVNTLEAERAELVAERSIGSGDARVGLRVATAELGWFEDRFAEFSRVYEWKEETGFVEVGPVGRR